MRILKLETQTVSKQIWMIMPESSQEICCNKI